MWGEEKGGEGREAGVGLALEGKTGALQVGQNRQVRKKTCFSD
jgi:hypothetical protein